MGETISWCLYLLVLGFAHVTSMLMAILLTVSGDWQALVFFGFALVMGWISHFVYRAKPQSQ